MLVDRPNPGDQFATARAATSPDRFATSLSGAELRRRANASEDVIKKMRKTCPPVRMQFDDEPTREREKRGKAA
jgi:hypothetical protein